MAYRSYNNNTEKGPTISTFSGISFANPESNIAQTRISIGYFNKVMKISIAMRNNGNSNNDYATYDNDNAVTVYVSNIKAEILYNLIKEFKQDNSVHNVCIELRNGLLKVSDGKEYNSSSPCISILYADEDGTTHEAIYETKSNFHSGAKNFKDGKFTSVYFDDMELDTFTMCLHEYYLSSSYAIANSVWEANMYRREYDQNILRAIADKVGAQTYSNQGKFNNKTFLSKNNDTLQNVTDIIPKEYETSTFDDIADGLIS